MTRPLQHRSWSLRRPVPARGDDGRRRRSGAWAALGVAAFLAVAAPSVWRYLVSYPREIWQVDLEVYRAGARALREGFPLYQVHTSSPQFLPFTYPPFAALAGLPLAWMSLTVAGWCWTALQLWLLWYVVGRSFAPLLERAGHRAGLLQGAVAGVCVWLLPVQDGLRYGQVNAIVVALCLADLTRRESASVPKGALVGFAVAVKLTPGVFWLHWAFGRQWRRLAASVGAFAVATLGAAAVVPQASWDFWTDALLDPTRLGPNDGTPNQSMRGILLRLGPAGTAGSLVWVVLAAAALAGGLVLARRLERAGEPVAVVAVLGLTAMLVSPVSWIHHAFWAIVVLGVVVGDGRRPARLVGTAVAAVLLTLRLPWWGGAWLYEPSVPRVLARVLQNSYAPLAVAGLVAIALITSRGTSRAGSEGPREPADGSRTPDGDADTGPAPTVGAGRDDGRTVSERR